MSAIGSFVKFPTSSLEQLRASVEGTGAEYNAILGQGTDVAEYLWSGYVLATLLPYLQERHQIDLMRSEHDELAKLLTETTGVSHFILTQAHRNAFLDRLRPELFSETEMCDYFNAFNATQEQDMGKAMLDGVTVFRQSLSHLDDNSVILFTIG